MNISPLFLAPSLALIVPCTATAQEPSLTDCMEGMREAARALSELMQGINDRHSANDAASQYIGLCYALLGHTSALLELLDEEMDEDPALEDFSDEMTRYLATIVREKERLEAASSFDSTKLLEAVQRVDEEPSS